MVAAGRRHPHDAIAKTAVAMARPSASAGSRGLVRQVARRDIWRGVGALMLAALAWWAIATVGAAQSNDTTASPEDPALASDLFRPDIPIEELAFRLVPLTREELGPLTEVWLGIVRETTSDIAELQVSLIASPELRTPETNRTLAQLVETRASQFERYTVVVDAFERKGGDPEQVSTLRAYRDAVLFEETMLASGRAIAFAILTWLTRPDGGLAVLRNLLIIAAAFAGLLVVARLSRGLTRRWLTRVPNLSKLLQVFLIGLVYWLVLSIGFLVVLAALGVNVSPVFAMIGGASFVLAFAFQDTLGNLASGLMIMINRPFDEGDYVLVGGVGGTVKTVSIVATTVTTGDNQVIVIPNKNVWGNVITNVTASETRRVDLVFGISYEDSIEEADRVINEVVRAHPLVLKEPEPVIRVHELGGSSVNFICRPWTQTDDYWTVYWDLTHQIKDAFTDAGISIPYPQQDVHIRSTSAQ